MVEGSSKIKLPHSKLPHRVSENSGNTRFTRSNVCNVEEQYNRCRVKPDSWWR